MKKQMLMSVRGLDLLSVYRLVKLDEVEVI